MSSQNEAHTSQIAATLASLTLNDAQRLTGEQIPYLGFIISKATQAIVARSDAALEPFGITSRHYGILYVISHEA
ncbi:MAG: hypothetical protein KC615_24305, partial [Anaerolineae bacterium]|nr:hypothetical protein [Anaerolineae bacterium]